MHRKIEGLYEFSQKGERNIMVWISPEVAAAALGMAKKGMVTIVGPALLKQGIKFVGKDHGSKVKKGAFQECPVEMFADKACIVVDTEEGEIVLLTSENIQSYRYIKKKDRMAHTYYYYEIVFHDGTTSYVRMRRKYRDAMINYT